MFARPYLYHLRTSPSEITRGPGHPAHLIIETVVELVAIFDIAVTLKLKLNRFVLSLERIEN